MAREPRASSLLLRLPSRTTLHANALRATLPFAWLERGRLLRMAHASLNELARELSDAQRVVLLLAASDVTLMRVPVPPLPAARLQAALPALVEDHVIGDPAECAIAAGPDIDGQRVIAVTDREWLQLWVTTLRQLGARRIAVLPMQLCLPLVVDHVSAALLESSSGFELALRYSLDEGIGLPVVADDESQLYEAVVNLLATFAPERTVQLSLPALRINACRMWLAEHEITHIGVVEENWSVWVEGAMQVSMDLVNGVRFDGEPIDWRRWRWPMSLAAACLLLNVIALNADWWRLRSEGLRLRDEMSAIYRRSFPNDKVVQDPLAQMKQKVATLRQASGEFEPGDFIMLSAALGEAWAETGNDMRAITSLEYRDGTLNVKLTSGAQVSLEVLRSSLASRQLQVAPSPADALVWQVSAR